MVDDNGSVEETTATAAGSGGLFGLDQLTKVIREGWVAGPGADPSAGPPPTATLLAVLETAYAASLTREEARQTSFAVLLAEPAELGLRALPTGTDHLVRFDVPIPFSPAELRRLAPATDPTHVLIGVSEVPPGDHDEPIVAIWGLLDIGQSWWRFVRHKASGASLPPDHLLVSSSEPGGLDVHRGGRRIACLKQGRLIDPHESGLREGPLGDFIAIGAEALYQEVAAEHPGGMWDPDGHDDDHPRRLYRLRIERLLIEVEAHQHGGTVLMVPDAWHTAPDDLHSVVSIKYAAKDRRLWDQAVTELLEHREYFDAHLDLLDRTSPITPAEYQQVSVLEARVQGVGEMVDDSVAFVASLTGVDGAVVLTDRLQLIGFGAEVIAPAPGMSRVMIAKDAVGSDFVERPISDFGTRHRSVFRFCWNLPNAMGFVVSQDGGIKGVRRVGDHVMVWPSAIAPLDL